MTAKAPGELSAASLRRRERELAKRIREKEIFKRRLWEEIQAWGETCAEKHPGDYAGLVGWLGTELSDEQRKQLRRWLHPPAAEG